MPWRGGLAAALLNVGADPAAPTMTGRMKCPTSPYWHTITPNADVWPTLSEYAEYVDTGKSRAVLARKAAVVQSGLSLTASNRLFDALRTEGQRLLAEWHFGADARMRGSRAALADDLHEALASFAERAGLGEDGVSYVTGKVADYLAAHFDAAKLEGPRRVRGRLLDVVDGLKTVKERQQAGGRHSGKAKGANVLQRLREAHQRLLAADEAVTRASLATAAGVSVRTATARWSEVVSNDDAQPKSGENRCIDKKVGLSTAGLPYTAPKFDIASDVYPPDAAAQWSGDALPPWPTAESGDVTERHNGESRCVSSSEGRRQAPSCASREAPGRGPPEGSG